MYTVFNYVTITILFHGLWEYCTCQEMRGKSDKYILVWNEPDTIPTSLFMTGGHAFKKYQCPITNCYVTTNKQYFHGSMKRFDAVIFNGRSLPKTIKIDRFDNQKYVYASMDPSTDYPICDPHYDGFFNWTATYKLDSDFIFSYMLIKNATGHVIGPRCNMNWINSMQYIDEKFSQTLRTKRKAAAWFVSKCTFRERNQYVYSLQEELRKYNLSIDIYGRCGDHRCPKNKLSECLTALRRDYFFYLALESVHIEDYVTEKLVPALQNYVVPIVYGGADYSRFLPPNSYLDGKNCTPQQLAMKMKELIQSPELYQQFFKWRRYYRFTSATPDGNFKGNGVCKLCEALHLEDHFPTATCIQNIRTWWNPNYVEDCKNFGTIKKGDDPLWKYKATFNIKLN